MLADGNGPGTFTYTYDGPTSRIATLTYPNCQTRTYSYSATGRPPAADDPPQVPERGDCRSRLHLRCRREHHDVLQCAWGPTPTRVAPRVRSSRRPQALRQQADTTAVLWGYQYDAADQLVSAITYGTDPQSTVLKRYAYAYDRAANRTLEQIDDQVTGATYDSLNRLVSQQPAGPVQFSGTVSEPATVTVQGVPAAVGGDNAFKAAVPLPSGTTTVTLTATDASANARTKQYEVDSLGTGRTFTYDANGNLTSDGARTFEWDARNQLLAVNEATHRSEFTYDGEYRRVRVVEKENGATQSDTRVVWCDKEICEERAADGTTVTRRAFERGEQLAGAAARFFAPDHLGSVEEVTDGTGTVLARYAFDPWGRRTVTAGTDVTTVGYAGYGWHADSSLSLTLYRGYDAELGRWVSQDPIGLQGGLNLFRYADNKPVRFNDPLGLAIWVCTRKAFSKNGPGNHSYFWNDRNGSCCGMGATSSCSEGGPKKDSCRKVEGSDGFEEEVLKCCRGTADAGYWFPYVNDCHQAVNDCLGKMNFQNPGSPGGRWGEPCDPCDDKKKKK